MSNAVCLFAVERLSDKSFELWIDLTAHWIPGLEAPQPQMDLKRGGIWNLCCAFNRAAVELRSTKGNDVRWNYIGASPTSPQNLCPDCDMKSTSFYCNREIDVDLCLAWTGFKGSPGNHDLKHNQWISWRQDHQPTSNLILWLLLLIRCLIKERGATSQCFLRPAGQKSQDLQFTMM